MPRQRTFIIHLVRPRGGVFSREPSRGMSFHPFIFRESRHCWGVSYLPDNDHPKNRSRMTHTHTCCTGEQLLSHTRVPSCSARSCRICVPMTGCHWFSKCEHCHLVFVVRHNAGHASPILGKHAFLSMNAANVR